VQADPRPRSAGLTRQFVHSQEAPAEAKAAREEPSASSVARRKHRYTFVSGRLAGRRFNFRDLAIAAAFRRLAYSMSPRSTKIVGTGIGTALSGSGRHADSSRTTSMGADHHQPAAERSPACRGYLVEVLPVCSRRCRCCTHMSATVGRTVRKRCKAALRVHRVRYVIIISRFLADAAGN